jgi:hypothetical protein
MSRVIKDDEELERARSGMFLLAAKLDKPNNGMSPQEREKQMKIYDRTVELIQKYERGQMVLKYPGLREAYQKLGHEIQEFDIGENEPITEVPTSTGSITPPPTETPPKTKQEPIKSESKPKANFSSWLD